MWEAAPSAWERVKRAKLREIEAHRRAINLHASTAAHFESTGARGASHRRGERAEHARAMLELAIKQAEAHIIDIN
jgi:hypothetical protein